MFHRSTTWWRALGALLLGLGLTGGAWPSPAGAASGPSFVLSAQSSTVPLGRGGAGTLQLGLRLTQARAGATAQVSLYPRVSTRSELAPLLAGSGLATAPSATTGNFTLTCDPAKVQSLSVTLFTRATHSHSPCASRAPRLHLPCVRAACDGVYPLSISVTSAGASTTQWSLVAVRVAAVAAPLHLSLVIGLDPSAWSQRSRAIAVLEVLAHHPDAPLALGADYRTLAQVSLSSSHAAARWRRALSGALASPLHRVDVTPPSYADLAGLARHGLAGQVNAQLDLASSLMRELSGRYPDAPVILSGHPSAATVAALGHVGVRDVVVPETSLVTPPSTTLTWGAPFHVSGAGSPLVLATDDPLDQLLANRSLDPARRAALVLGTLALLHYEAPSVSATRSVVLDVSAAAMGPQTATDLLDGLSRDPYATPSSLTPSFDPASVGAFGSPTLQPLVATAASSWSAHNVSSLSALIADESSFTQAITDPAVLTPLKVALAEAEGVGGPAARQSAIAAAAAHLARQTDQFSVDDGPITLAGPATALPVTILSRAHYTVTVLVHLVTDRLRFPKGARVPVALSSPTTSLRVLTASTSGSSLTLQIVVTTPDGRLTLARAAIQVRVAGTSIVGYLLTGASLLVLAWWWWRTYRRRSRGRHAS